MSFLRVLLAAVFSFYFSAGLALAQSSVSVDYQTWNTFAGRAEQTMVAGRASDSVLEALRNDLSDWRDDFQKAQQVNKDRIETIKAQLDALGPVPEDGIEDVVADRRAELTSQLATLTAPVTTAVEAYSRADGLIREIDTLLRERQTSVLFSVGPNPLNPANWALALKDTTKTIGQPVGSVNSFIGPLTFKASVTEYFSSFFFVLLGLAIIFVGTRMLTSQTSEWNRLSPRLGATAEFLREISGLVVLPLLGIGALSIGLQMSEVFGARGQMLLVDAPIYVSRFFIAFWVYYRLFDPKKGLLIRYSQIKFLMISLVAVYVARTIIFAYAEFDFYTANTKAVIGLPLIVLASLLLFRLMQLLQLRPRENAEEGERNVLGHRFLRLLIMAGKTIAILSPLMAIAGFGHISNALVFPFIKTILQLGLIFTFHTVLTRLVNVLFGYEKDAETLLSIVVAFVLVAVWMPFLALNWGIRETDLQEIWTKFLNGFKLGETTVTPSAFIAFVLIFVIGYTLTRFIQSTLKSTVLPKTKLEIGAQNALVSGFGYIGIFLAALIAISSTGLDLSSLAIVAGALSVGIGFGLQNIVSNFVSGIILLIERPVSEGDWIEVGGQMGYVRNISVRSTRIETFDRSDVIIPNADLVSGVVTNWTRGNTIGRVIIPVGVAYGNDTRRVEAVLREIIEAHPMVILNPSPTVIFMAFGADSLNFEIRAILRDVNWSNSVRSDINHTIAERFAAEGIEIPYAQRDIWIRNPEALRGGHDENQS